MVLSIRLFLSLAAITLAGSAAPLTVHLHANLPSPQPVGATISLTPKTENMAEDMHAYRYSVSTDGGPFRIIRDFSQTANFAWSPELHEHTATIRITARNNKSKETAQDEMRFQIASRIKGKSAVVTPSAHPLIALFSAPPCPQGSTFRVTFEAVGDNAQTHTPNQPCRGSISNNIWIAGMRADTDYRMRAEWTKTGNTRSGDWLPFHTGILPGGLASVSASVPYVKGVSASDPIHIYAAFSLDSPVTPFAVDLQGRTIWYSRTSDEIFRVVPGGRFLTVGEGMNSANSEKVEQILTEFDVAGNIIRQTNASRVAEQLESYGIHSDCKTGGKECVSGFHHEALRLPNGHTLVIAGLERMMPAGTQGAKEPVDVLGDIVVDLDEEFQVTNMWNEFDHLDIQRKSYKDAKCKTGQGGCPPVLLAKEAQGWTHSNSIDYIASTGDFVISIPEQEWVLKVDWKNGKGTGKILWRLGNGGDLKPIANDPNPWFSYAHDIGFEPAGSNMLAIMDNSHVAFDKDKTFQSRAQVWKIDEAAKSATLVYNASLGAHSICCGSIQRLPNGGYNSLVGWINPRSSYGRTAETDKNGKTVFALEITGVGSYRSFNVSNMYSAPVR